MGAHRNRPEGPREDWNNYVRALEELETMCRQAALQAGWSAPDNTRASKGRWYKRMRSAISRYDTAHDLCVGEKIGPYERQLPALQEDAR